MIIFKGGEKIDLGFDRQLELSIAVWTKYPIGSNTSLGEITPSKTAFCTVVVNATTIFDIRKGGGDNYWAFLVYQSEVDKPLFGITMEDLHAYASEYTDTPKCDMAIFFKSDAYKNIEKAFSKYIIDAIANKQ